MIPFKISLMCVLRQSNFWQHYFLTPSIIITRFPWLGVQNAGLGKLERRLADDTILCLSQVFLIEKSFINWDYLRTDLPNFFPFFLWGANNISNSQKYVKWQIQLNRGSIANQLRACWRYYSVTDCLNVWLATACFSKTILFIQCLIAFINWNKNLEEFKSFQFFWSSSMLWRLQVFKGVFGALIPFKISLILDMKRCNKYTEITISKNKLSAVLNYIGSQWE